jgi:glycosyltransferase involved in cell wall biosynthesis
MNPLVSICIPSYNAEKYIKETIISALSQTYQNIEVIIVDDHSNDRTIEIIKSFSDPRISLHINKKNLGPSITWNKLIDLAQGRYLKILCHDDIIYKSCIEKQIQAFLNNTGREVAIVASNRDIINYKGKKLLTLSWIKNNQLINGRALFMKSVRRGTNLIGEPHASLIDINIIRKYEIRFGNNFYLLDLDFYSKVLIHGDCYLIKDTLSAFRLSTDSASYLMARKQTYYFNKFIKDIMNSGEYEISYIDYLLFITRLKIHTALKMIFYRINFRYISN